MNKICVTVSLALALLAMTSLAFAGPVELQLDKTTVEIGTFYNGTTVQATGTVPAGAEAVIRVSGKPQELHLKKKGKAGGILWMNIGDLTFDNAPKIYMLYTSEAAKNYLADANLNFSLPSLQNRIEIFPANEDKAFYFNEFLKLKKKESIYAEFPGEVTYSDTSNGERQFQATLQIPPRMGADDYTIDVFALQEGRITGQDSKTLQVRMISFPQMLSKLAYNRSLLYGILSVLVAVAAGLFMGIVFRDKGSAH
jgi:hypothetical protein